MMPPSRRNFLGGLCSCSALATLAFAQTACTTTGSSGPEANARIEPGYRPSSATDEGGLWKLTEKAEADIKRSRFLVRDAALHDYVHEIACRVAQDHCSDTRLYIMRTPVFNASMMPNGAMQIWTGLLLRTQNEAQLAAVIGHEMGHYLHRHALERYRDMRAKADFGAFFGMALGAVGSLGQLALLASVYAFSREQERQADAVGMELMSAAGYAPIEASKIWSQMVAELDADPVKESPGILTATHPNPAERAEVLQSKAAALPKGERYVERYRDKTTPLRPTLFEDELRLRQFNRSLKLFEIMAAESGEDVWLAFYIGEAYRQRSNDGDAKLAIEAYERVMGWPNPPPQTYRSLGLLHMSRGDNAASSAAFGEYLRRQPDADDRDMIRSYMSRTS